jgi:ribosomal protein S18 acetylase RimI-like enzyme
MPEVCDFLTVRHATAADEAAVVVLWKECGLVTSYNDPGQDFWFAFGKAGSNVLVGVDKDGVIRGSAMVGQDGHRGWVYYVASDPTLRKRGIGRRMVQAAEDWLRERGVVKLMLLVRDTNTQVVDFYGKIGFQAVPRVVMEKWLNKA